MTDSTDTNISETRNVWTAVLADLARPKPRLVQASTEEQIQQAELTLLVLKIVTIPVNILGNVKQRVYAFREAKDKAK
jgi:hypothetical protein